MPDFRGIYCAILTPFDADENLDLKALDRLNDFLFDAGVDGLYVNGSTGEGVFMTPEERMTVAERCVKCARGRGAVIVHVGAMTTRESCRLAAHAEKIGADAVSSVPPMYFRYGPAEVKAHYVDIAAACGLPLFAYHIPGLVPFAMSAEFMGELMKIPTMRGLKFTDMDLYAERKMIAANEAAGITVFHGMDEVFLAGLMMGAHAGIGGTYNMQPRSIVGIYKAFKRGDYAEATRLQYRVTAYIPPLQKFSTLPALRLVMKWKGVDVGRCRRPLRPLSDDEGKRLRKMLDDLGGLPE